MVNDVHEMVDWYRAHETTAELGYNPDGMCLKIAHDASDVPALYPSAFAAQHATPAKYQVTKVADLRRGMKLFFDDPTDDNPFGHVTSMVGRVKGSDPNDLNGVLVRTNSVKSGQVVVVRATYFKTHWGDDFQFGATWLNGVVLDMNWDDPKPKPKPSPVKPTVKAIRAAIKELQAQLAKVEGTGHPRIVNALKRDIATLQKSIQSFS